MCQSGDLHSILDLSDDQNSGSFDVLVLWFCFSHPVYIISHAVAEE